MHYVFIIYINSYSNLYLLSQKITCNMRQADVTAVAESDN